ncbi:unnamed protein product, partial [Owenia fusiformis]
RHHYDAVRHMMPSVDGRQAARELNLPAYASSSSQQPSTSHPVQCAVDENITVLQISKLKNDIEEIKEEVVLGKRKYDKMEVQANGLKQTNAKLRKKISRLTKEKMAAIETSE